jgi:hypothetical protein
MTDYPRLTLRKAGIAFGLACLLVMLAVPTIFALLRGDRFTDSTLDYTARFRTNAAAEDLARTLERDWRDLLALTSPTVPLRFLYFISDSRGHDPVTIHLGR